MIKVFLTMVISDAHFESSKRPRHFSVSLKTMKSLKLIDAKNCSKFLLKSM